MSSKRFSFCSNLTIFLTIVQATVAKKIKTQETDILMFLNVSHYLPILQAFWVEHYLLRSLLGHKLSVYLECLTCDS